MIKYLSLLFILLNYYCSTQPLPSKKTMSAHYQQESNIQQYETQQAVNGVVEDNLCFNQQQEESSHHNQNNLVLDLGQQQGESKEIKIRQSLPHQRNQSPKKKYSNQQSLEKKRRMRENSKMEYPLTKQCRICLENQDEGRMLKPCLCSGSVSYAHEKCIKQWIRIKQNPNSLKQKISCQMCHTPLSYRIGKNRKLCMAAFSENYKKNRCGFIRYFLFGFILLMASITMASMISISKDQSKLGRYVKRAIIPDNRVQVIFICLVFISCTVLMFTTILFVMTNGFKSQMVIIDVQNYETALKLKQKARARRNIQVHPRTRQSSQESSLSSSQFGSSSSNSRS